MQITSGKVVGGRVELDTELPEGASVTIIAPGEDEGFDVDAVLEQTLRDSIAQCERGQSVPLRQVLDDLRSRE